VRSEFVLPELKQFQPVSEELAASLPDPYTAASRVKWAYHFPEPHKVAMRCPHENGWISHTLSLGGTGLIHNASTCHISSQEIRTLALLSKTTELPLDTPRLYLPDEVPTAASHEISRIEAAMPPETTGLEYVEALLVMPRQSFDVYTLLRVHQKSVHRARGFYWLRLATILVCTTTIIQLLFFS
jgi:hypothetical protein